MTGNGEHTPTVGAAIALPTVQLLVFVPLAAAIVGGVWVGVVNALNYSNDTAVAGLAGAGLVAVVTLASVLVMTPWKPRPMDLWMTFWLGGTVLRLLVTPAGAFLLYSATALPAEPLALAVATAYLVTVLTETAVLARHVGRRSAAHRLPAAQQPSDAR